MGEQLRLSRLDSIGYLTKLVEVYLSNLPLHPEVSALLLLPASSQTLEVEVNPSVDFMQLVVAFFAFSFRYAGELYVMSAAFMWQSI